MVASILILILSMPIAFLPYALSTLFSSRELIEMGVYMEEPEITHFVPNAEMPSQSCCLCL